MCTTVEMCAVGINGATVRSQVAYNLELWLKWLRVSVIVRPFLLSMSGNMSMNAVLVIAEFLNSCLRPGVLSVSIAVA